MPPKKKVVKDGEDDKGKKGGQKPAKLKFNKIDWEQLIKELKTAWTSQENVRRQIAGLMPQYTSLREGEPEDFVNTDGRALKKITRQNAATRLTRAQSQLEDFLFYQNQVNRWKRFHPTKPTPNQSAEARKLNREPMLIEHAGDNERFQQYLRDMLNYYDERGIGTSRYRYRQGNLEAGGAEAGSGAQRILLEPEDLHRVTSAWRRVPVGLREQSVLRDMEKAAREPILFRVNEEAIEKLRKRWDDAPNETAGVRYKTHTERRQAELRDYENTRPSTANIVVKPSKNGGQTDQDMFRKIQTASGVFVSALESSYDWLTSYDCLGLVKNCSVPENFETSAIREEDRFDGPPDEDEDLDARFNPPSDTLDGANGEEDATDDAPGDKPKADQDDATEYRCGQAPRDGASDASKDDESDDLPVNRKGEAAQDTVLSTDIPDDVDVELRNGKRLSSSPLPKAKRTKRKTNANKAEDPVPTVNKVVGNDPASKNEKKKKGPERPDANKRTKRTTEDESQKQTRANIDYPYEKQEFCLPKKTREVNEGRLTTTAWAEATDGRRERHVGMIQKPSSPVNSPPRSPIKPDIVDMSTIPEACGENEDLITSEKSLPNYHKRRRCKHNNPTCRAWWTHATDECWVVHEEPTSLPTNRMDIDKPVMLKVPEEGRKTYCERLHDHYGRRGQGKATWPRLGIRVAYEPTTFAGLTRQGTNVSLRGWRSLAMPVIEEALTPGNTWNMKPDTIDNHDSSDGAGDLTVGNEDESDYDGDLFHESYITCSVPGGRPVPIVSLAAAPGDVPSEGIVSVDVIAASVATATTVSEEDEQMGGNAGDL